ncbi:ankyrin repeat domain-containing protein 9-like [Dendropsophus ebraccatus]|uniref:ankyrin repeat domain-containing protein 9-like n=1 Tax=Dendropsophus ebraccatus TaxID=150705 RepID=UPI00383111A6
MEEDHRAPHHPSDMFHWAIKNHEPVSKLENLRAEVYFDWEEDPEDQSYSPSDALLYAIIYNHIPYAQHLLLHFPEESIKVPGSKCDQRPHYSFHLGLAVIYNCREILIMIIETSQRDPLLRSYINLDNYFYSMDGKTPLHLACELLRSDLILILLCHGATSRTDIAGRTPMDILLTQLWSSGDNMKLKMQCLHHLLLFAPPGRLQMRKNLRDNWEYWGELLGEDIYTYLLGENVLTLSLISMKKVVQQLAPSTLWISIQRLPIPHNLKNNFTLDY